MPSIKPNYTKLFRQARSDTKKNYPAIFKRLRAIDPGALPNLDPNKTDYNRGEKSAIIKKAIKTIPRFRDKIRPVKKDYGFILREIRKIDPFALPTIKGKTKFSNQEKGLITRKIRDQLVNMGPRSGMDLYIPPKRKGESLEEYRGRVEGYKERFGQRDSAAFGIFLEAGGFDTSWKLIEYKDGTPTFLGFSKSGRKEQHFPPSAVPPEFEDFEEDIEFAFQIGKTWNKKPTMIGTIYNRRTETSERVRNMIDGKRVFNERERTFSQLTGPEVRVDFAQRLYLNFTGYVKETGAVKDETGNYTGLILEEGGIE